MHPIHFDGATSNMNSIFSPQYNCIIYVMATICFFYYPGFNKAHSNVSLNNEVHILSNKVPKIISYIHLFHDTKGNWNEGKRIT